MGPLLPDGGILDLYVDELVNTSKDDLKNTPSHLAKKVCEVFLQGLTPELTSSEVALKEWLREKFGDVKECTLLFDQPGPQRRATGRAYARFKSHEDARKLVHSIPMKDPAESQKVLPPGPEEPSGSWSLSELIHKGVLCDMNHLKAQVQQLQVYPNQGYQQAQSQVVQQLQPQFQQAAVGANGYAPY